MILSHLRIRSLSFVRTVAGLSLALALGCNEANPPANSSPATSPPISNSQPREMQNPPPDGRLTKPGGLRSLDSLSGRSSAPAPHLPAGDSLANRDPSAPTHNPSNVPSADAPPRVPNQPSDGTVIPPRAEWSIYCLSIGASDHFHKATVLKAQLAAATKMSGFYIVNADQEATLYYGFYSDFENDTPDGARAHQDLERLRTFADAAGQHPLQACWMMQLATADPAAPPEFNLLNVNKGKSPGDARAFCWSLEIGVYKGAKERKQFAVNAVIDMRKAGIPAYFYHGPNASSVCVGAWPAVAVREQETAVSDIHSSSESVVVISPNLPQPRTNEKIVGRDGEEVTPLTNRVDIVDPSLKEMMQKYPDHYVNGENIISIKHDRSSNQDVEVPHHSIVVKIPGTDSGHRNDVLDPYQIGLENMQRNRQEKSDLPEGLQLPGSSSDSPSRGNRLKSIGQ